MSAFTRRRSSGEIINATLLEVFLAATFMVFALAIFEQRRADDAESKLANQPTAEQTKAFQDSLAKSLAQAAAARHAAALWSDSLAAAQATIRRLQFDSPYPPDCEHKENPPWLLTVTLAGPRQLIVVPHRPAAGLTPGESLAVTPEGFRARFEALRATSQSRGCRYFVRVRDTPNMPKADYKSAMSVITSIFRFRGAFQ